MNGQRPAHCVVELAGEQLWLLALDALLATYASEEIVFLGDFLHACRACARHRGCHASCWARNAASCPRSAPSGAATRCGVRRRTRGRDGRCGHLSRLSVTAECLVLLVEN